MPIRKSELYSALWKSCDELRGGMDASQYKDYVLVLLFVKYVSDKYAGQKGALLDVPKGGRFADMVALKGDKEIGDKMNKIISKLAEANDLKGVIDVADFNDADKLGKGKEMVDRLSNLVSIFDNPSLDFSANRAEGDDLLGDAYEYLMRHFATESGKSKGQFYTPAEVSRVMAKVVGVGSAKSASQTIHDPTCGSGSLLLKAHDEAKGTAGLDLALYGQEMDNATSALARMNMILHDCPTAEIWKDNVLAGPHFKAKDGALKTFDFVVANPPFSFKAWSNGFNPAEDEFKRFEFGVPPAKNGDHAFLLHILTCLKSAGKAAVNLPHGVLFRGGAEASIRREIVRRGHIKGIIGLPANLFYGTGIPACVVVLDKENAHARKGIFMIDASKGFIKDGNKNRLRAQDIHRIVDTFTRQLEVPRYSRMVPLAEIGDPKNDFNLNLPRYIDSSEPEDLQDIDAHLRGGIPDRDIDALGGYWEVIPSIRAVLFESAGRPGYVRLKLPVVELKAAIFGHPEFTAPCSTASPTPTSSLRRSSSRAISPPSRSRSKRSKPSATRSPARWRSSTRSTEARKGCWPRRTGFAQLGSPSCDVMRVSRTPPTSSFTCFGAGVSRQIEALLTGSNYPAINSREVLLVGALEERYRLLASVPLMVEYEAVLTRQEHLEAGGLSSGDVQDVLDAVASIIEPVRLAYLWRPTLPDAQDDMVLETAINGRAEVLVTLNRRHFEPAASTFAVQIVSPAEAVARLRKPR